MPAADLTPGFFGKIPSTGDFVTRGLTPDFVRAWDAWVTLHLAPFQQADAWADDLVLCFLLGDRFLGPMAGVVMPSSDRAGRQFPLTVASRLAAVQPALAGTAFDWFEAIARTAARARDGDLDADALADGLTGLTFPMNSEPSGMINQVVMWVSADDLLDVDPSSPGPAITELLAARPEPG